MNNKKILYIAIAAIVVIAVVLAIVFAGGNNTTNNTTTTTEKPVELPYKNATELLTLAWDKLPHTINDGGTSDNTEDDLCKYIEYEGEKYYQFVGGFELDAEQIPVQVEGAPGNYMLDGDMLDYQLGYPASNLTSIDNAASLMFGMNQNTFTCGAYHLVDGVNVSELANTIEQNIQGRMWMCGFPEKVVIVEIPGNYLISIFGHTIVDTFVDAILAAVDGAKVIIDNPIQ